MPIPSHSQPKKIECPSCGGEAKKVRKPISRIIRKPSWPGTKYKCSKCGHEFILMF